MQPPPPGGQFGGNGLRATQGQRSLRPRPGWQCQGPCDLPTVGPEPSAQPVAIGDVRGPGWSPVPQCHPLGRALLALRLPRLVGDAMGLPPSSPGRDKGQRVGGSPCSPQPWVAGRAARPWQEPEPRGFGQGPGGAADESVRPEHPGLRWGLGFVFFLQRDKSSNLSPAFGSWVGRWKRHVAKDGEETPAPGDLAQQSPAPLGNRPPLGDAAGNAGRKGDASLSERSRPGSPPSIWQQKMQVTAKVEGKEGAPLIPHPVPLVPTPQHPKPGHKPTPLPVRTTRAAPVHRAQPRAPCEGTRGSRPPGAAEAAGRAGERMLTETLFSHPKNSSWPFPQPPGLANAFH